MTELGGVADGGERVLPDLSLADALGLMLARGVIERALDGDGPPRRITLDAIGAAAREKG